MKVFFLLLLLTIRSYGQNYSWKDYSGEFTISTGWTVNDLNLDAIQGELKYFPKKRTCDKIGFIQIARMTDNHNQNLKFSLGSGLSPRNEMLTLNNFFIDHNPVNCRKRRKCSPYFVDHWPEGGNFYQKNSSYAKMSDYPFGWEEFSKIELESCAVCVSNQKPLGCIKWGGEFSLAGVKKIQKPTWNKKESEDFRKALNMFSSFYK
jgi:hypothetical protein